MDEELKYRYIDGQFPRAQCKCGGIADVAQVGDEINYIYAFVCQVCQGIIIHPHSCDTCALKGTVHMAEFNDLHDEDGGKFFHLVLPEIELPPGLQAWIFIHGCKSWRSKEESIHV